MVNDTSKAVSERREAYLRCVCAALNFDVGEIWSWRDDENIQKEAGGGEKGVMSGGDHGDSDSDSGSSSGSSSIMRFIQLYTSPSFRNQRSKLVTPSEDWEQSKGDVSKHKFSPLICEAVRDGGAVVWANTAVEGGLLGRSDLPLRTAVGAPVCTQSGDLCVLVLFSPTIIEKSPEAMDFLFTLAQVASNATNAFLPASNPSLVQHVTFPSFWWRDTQARLQRLNAIRESLPRDVIFDTGTLAMGPFGHPERSLLGVRSVYKDPASGGSVIPIELLTNRGGGGKAGILGSVVSSGLGVYGPGALKTTDNRSEKAAGSGEAGGGSSTPKRRASFQSNAPIDLGLSSSAAPDEGTELEDYNLWVAFMETETLPDSPSSTSMAAPSGQDVGEGGVSGNNEDASFRSLSALLSTSTSVTSFASLSSDDENDNSDVGLSVFASPVTLKQELADEPRDANGEHVDSQQFGVSGAGLVGAEAAVDGNGVSSDIGSSTSNEMVVSSLMTSPKQRGMVWNEQKWARFNEFIGGMLSVSPFQAADVWLPVAQGAEDAETKASRLFLFNSNIQSQDSRLSKWSEVSRNVVLASGVGLPGLVFQERRPQWAVDYSKVDSSRNPLASIARMLGIGSAFGVPLPLDDNDECGVVMLYSTSCLPPSELMVEVVERATWLLLADAPVSNTLRQRCREKELSAKDIGRIAGAYKHHALWDQQKNQNGTISNSGGSGNNKRQAEGSSTPKRTDDPTSSSESAPQSESGTGGWAGMESAFAAAAAAAASGGQGGGFRADGGAVAFIPPRGWSSIENPSPELVFDRVDLDGRSSFIDDNEAAKTAVEAAEPPSSPSPSPTRPLQTQTSMRQPHQSQPKRKPQLSVIVSSALRSKSTLTAARIPRNEADERSCTIGAATKRPRLRRDADNGEEKGAAASVSLTSPVTSTAAGTNGVVSPSTGKGKAGARKGCVAGSVTPVMKWFNKEESAMPEEEEEEPTANSRGGQVGSRKPVVALVEGGEELISPGGNADALSNSTGMSKCRSQGCDKIPNPRTPFCWDHWSAARQCQHVGCEKLSQGNTRLCIAHGGGRRCTHPGCNKGARDRFFCAAHGGGKRCSMAGCGKAAVGGSDLCTAHGGGKRCQIPDCPKSAQSKTNFCVRHGGGRKCAVEGCAKVARGRTSHCAAHGGGIRCCVEGCNKAAVGRERMCRSHQRKHKAGLIVGTSSITPGCSQSSTVDRACQEALASPSRASTDSSSTALSVLSAAAETHGFTDFLESTSLSPQPPPQPFTARANGSSGFLRWGGVEAGVTVSGNGGGGGAQSIFSQAILGESDAVSRNKHSLSVMNGNISGADSIEGAMFGGGGGGGGKRVRRLASPILRGSSS